MKFLLINTLRILYALPTVEDVSKITKETFNSTDQSLIEKKVSIDKATEDSLSDLTEMAFDNTDKTLISNTIRANEDDTEISKFENDTKITRQVTFTNLRSLYEDNTTPERALEQYCDCRRYYNPAYCRCNVWRPNNGGRYYPTKSSNGRNPFVTQFDERNDVEWVLHLRTNFPNRLGKHFKREIRETTTPIPSKSTNLIYEETITDQINGTESNMVPTTDITMPYVALISLTGIFFLGLIVCCIKKCLKHNRSADFTSDRRK